jgi:CRP/FNR family transcriptional regulator
VAATLSRRLDDSCDNLSNLALSHVAARVARLILHTGQAYGTHVGKNVDLDIPLTQQEIADMVGAARQTVSSILSALKHEGVISMSRRHIRIENEERLRELAERNGAREPRT